MTLKLDTPSTQPFLEICVIKVVYNIFGKTPSNKLLLTLILLSGAISFESDFIILAVETSLPIDTCEVKFV